MEEKEILQIFSKPSTDLKFLKKKFNFNDKNEYPNDITLQLHKLNYLGDFMSNYQMANVGEMYYFKLSGKLRYTDSGAFDSIVTNLVKNHKCKNVIVDLNLTTYMDSTNLGILARLAGGIFAYSHDKISIISKNVDIISLLENCGFEQICNIISTYNDPQLENLSLKEMDDQKREKSSMMYESHKYLAEMNKENKLKFKDVVEILKKSIK